VIPSPLDYARPSPRQPRLRGLEPVLLDAAVVVAALALLLGIVTPWLRRSSRPSLHGAARTDLSTLEACLRVFAADNGRYPTAGEGLNALVVRPAGLPAWRSYIPALPADPWGSPYRYAPDPPGAARQGGYFLASPGPDRRLGTDDDLGFRVEGRTSRPRRAATGTAPGPP
jgi:general secretion pathway protein G